MGEQVKVMIMGAAGFLGSTTAIWLMQKTKWPVVSVDNLSETPDLFNLEAALRGRDRHEFYLADIRDLNIMDKVFQIEKPTVVIYLARGHDLNRLDNLKDLLPLARKHCDDPHIIAVQSDVNNFGDYRDSEMQRFENLVSQERITVLNTCRIFGSRQYPTFFIPNLIGQIFSKQTLDVKDLNRGQSYEWMYVGDFFSALLAIIRDGSRGKVYGVSSGHMASDAEIGFKLSQIAGIEAIGLPDQAFIETYMNCYDLFELGWKSEYPLEEALEHTLRWYSDNGQWIYRNKL
jgi:dTDP-D-glucose 4,6-dehydratase